MTEIRAVVFDYGNVLCHEHLDSDLQAMASCLGSELPEFKAAYWHFRLDFDAGAFTGQRYFTLIAEQCAVPITPEKIKQCVELDNIGWSRPNHPMVEWAIRLRENGITTAILSNMPLDFRDYLPNISWLPQFDHYTLSCEVKSVKPAPEIYHHCLNGLGVEPEHVLFIDDRLPNIDAAKALKWQGFHFTHVDELHQFIKNTKLPSLRTQTTNASAR
jgi:putative hydrolase of the HAD superfamily